LPQEQRRGKDGAPGCDRELLVHDPILPLAGLGAVLSDTADHLRTSRKPMLAKLRSVSGIA